MQLINRKHIIKRQVSWYSAGLNRQQNTYRYKEKKTLWKLKQTRNLKYWYIILRRWWKNWYRSQKNVIGWTCARTISRMRFILLTSVTLSQKHLRKNKSMILKKKKNRYTENRNMLQYQKKNNNWNNWCWKIVQ